MILVGKDKKCDYGEVYNIGGDETLTVGDGLDLLISKSTLDNLKKKLTNQE